VESQICPGNDPDFGLIETFGYVPGQGVARLGLHLARLERSARVFGIACPMAAVRDLIADLSGDRPLRCRLTLARDGALDLRTGPMPPRVDRWRFAIATDRLDAGDRFLRHKTTRRALYDRIRAGLPSGLDEMVFLNHRGELCEGTISTVAITTADGARLTPPLSSGCLPGVCRQSLLDAGQLQEAVLTLGDLACAREIQLMNALRGVIKATWVRQDVRQD